jgi:hypothetical protein
MNAGMLWFDDDPKADLKAKINKASVYYRKKYGQEPNLCLVNPCLAAEVKNNSVPIKIQVSQFILPHHFWIGVSK